mmetsp:Transcript_26579/g.61033  ORF Transcript_26579/g.61033 Transcript_26579/m.61033 type:complete len:744 (+) Transcript_26579:92-2323(+)
MKTSILCLLALCNLALGAQVQLRSGDRTITRVVKMLQDMLDKSKADGEQERTLYGKFKCYCDDNEEEKTTAIEEMTSQIGYLENDIAKLQAENGMLSTEVAEIQASIEANDAAVAEANSIRSQNNAAFVALKDDLEQAISQMSAAINVLSEVGADQTLQSARDHEKFMAGYNSPTLLKLRSRVTQALSAATALMPTEKKAKVNAFVQAPFTGNYAAQSGEVVGILKDMRDTFKQNLAAAAKQEAKEVAAHAAFIEAKAEEKKALEASWDKKQSQLGANSADIATKKGQLESAKAAKQAAEDFLAELRPMCAAKAKDFEARNLMRSKEEAAIGEAIAILNSDAAFATFGKVDATRTGGLSLLQLRASRKHAVSAVDMLRQQAERILMKVAKKEQSKKLTEVVQALRAGNPFDIVLQEIDKMIDLLAVEGKQDADNLAWCNEERSRTNSEIAAKDAQILALEGRIDSLESDISGIKRQIETSEAELSQCMLDQETETTMRKEENEDYQADIAHLTESQELLNKAIVVLKNYYAEIVKKIESSLLQKESPDPPATWEGAYAGQSETGTSVIDMLEYVLSQAKLEETTAHSDEESAQKSYEDSMIGLKDQQETLENTLVTLHEALAVKEKDLLEAQEDLKATAAAKAALEEYLLKIKPGCDFITANKDARDTHRASEKAALDSAKDLIKNSPVYLNAVEAARVAAMGKCKDKCFGFEETAACKACLSDVTVPGYCAGHPGTAGCESL